MRPWLAFFWSFSSSRSSLCNLLFGRPYHHKFDHVNVHLIVPAAVVPSSHLATSTFGAQLPQISSTLPSCSLGPCPSLHPPSSRGAAQRQSSVPLVQQTGGSDPRLLSRSSYSRYLRDTHEGYYAFRALAKSTDTLQEESMVSRIWC